MASQRLSLALCCDAMAVICYAKRLTFEPAAAMDAAVELVLGAAGLLAAAAGLLDAGDGFRSPRYERSSFRAKAPTLITPACGIGRTS
jgi:hypothetical protein